MKQKLTLLLSCLFFVTATAFSQEKMKKIEITTKDENSNVNKQVVVVPSDESVTDYINKADFPKSVKKKLSSQIEENYKEGEKFLFVQEEDGTEYKFEVDPDGDRPAIARVQRFDFSDRLPQLRNIRENISRVVPLRNDRAFVGLMVEPFLHRDSETMSHIRGVEVKEVIEGEAAYNAGLKPGDVITSVNGIETPSPSLFMDAVEQVEPRKKVVFSLYRDGEAMELESVAGIQKGNLLKNGDLTFHPFKLEEYMAEMPRNARLGVHVQDINNGAEIGFVEKESAAEEAGLQKGDIITEIDGKKVEQANDVVNIIGEKEEGDIVKITYLRNEKEMTTKAELQQPKHMFFPFPNIETEINIDEIIDESSFKNCRKN